MRVLLDTHSLLWYVDQDQLLSSVAHGVITDPDNELLLSAASLWEIAIKAALGKLSLSQPYLQWMSQALTDLGVGVLPITVQYADAQIGLPMHHRDPFDRLMIAQANIEGVPIVSADSVFERYAITRLW